MADEALTELLAELNADGLDCVRNTLLAPPGGRELFARRAVQLKAYADALESALSELARLRAERDSGMDHLKTVPPKQQEVTQPMELKE